MDLICILQNDLEIALQSVLAPEWGGCKVRKLNIFSLRATYLTLNFASLPFFIQMLIIQEKT